MAKKVKTDKEIAQRVAVRMAEVAKRMLVYVEEHPPYHVKYGPRVYEMEIAYWQEQLEKYLVRAGR